MRQSVMEHARPSISTMKPEKDMYRTSLFQQNEKQYSSAPQRDLEAGSSDSTEVCTCNGWMDKYSLNWTTALDLLLHFHHP